MGKCLEEEEGDGISEDIDGEETVVEGEVRVRKEDKEVESRVESVSKMKGSGMSKIVSISNGVSRGRK